MNTLGVLGLEITGGTYDEIIQEVDRAITKKEKFIFHNVNSHILIRANKYEEFKNNLQQFSTLFIDGVGVYLASKFLYGNHKKVKRITGTDLYYHIVDYAIRNKRKVFFLGVNSLTSEAIRSYMVSKYPTLNVVGTECDNGFNDKEMTDKINNANPEILFVGLGTPKQEEFIIKNKQKINCPVLISVGSGIEYLAGIKTRAPKFMQNLGLEWLFRLFLEPKRLWRRYLFGIPHFMLLIFKQKLNASDKIH